MNIIARTFKTCFAFLCDLVDACIGGTAPNYMDFTNLEVGKGPKMYALDVKSFLDDDRHFGYDRSHYLQ